MLVVKKTGLVPVVSLKRGGRSGVYGVPPTVALAGLLAKEISLADIPAEIEVYEVAGPADEPAPEPVVVDDGPVVIPDEWEKQHPLSWIKLAKAITGKDIVLTDEQKQAEVKPSQVAKGIIEAEIQRRAAAESSAQ